MDAVPSLESICVEVTAAHDFWVVQKRHVQHLPEHVANRLLQLLLQRGRLQEPKELDSFRHCATCLALSAQQLGAHQQMAEWLAYVAGLSHLQDLSLVHVPRLKDKHLAPLTRLAGSLLSLQLTGCSAITKAACPLLLGQLTNLQSLGLSGTGIRPPFLQQLSRLKSLTTLDLGGCQVSDAELRSSLPHFTNLRHLTLWGCTAGDAVMPLLAQLPQLQQLDMAWSLLRAAAPAVVCSSLRQLDMSHCKLEGSWEEVATAAALAASSCSAGSSAAGGLGEGVLLRDLRLVHAVVSAGTAEVLESCVRSSSDTLQLLDATHLSTDSLLPLLLALQSAVTLAALSLASTRLPDDFLPTLVPCTALQTLDLSQNPDVTAAGLQATLPALQLLQQVNLAGTGVSDAVLAVLGQLPMLKELVLTGTAVTWDCEWDADSATDQQQQQQQQDEVHAGIPGSSSSNRSPSSERQTGNASGKRPWQQLRVLDLLRTHVTDAGCQQLARQLAAAAAAESVNEDGLLISGGLRVLLVGSSSGSRGRLGKQGLSALAGIGSLQQLTLQRWQLQEHDLAALEPLQQLQQLHTAQLDPWLVSDAALIGLAAVLPSLQLVMRDGKALLAAAGAAAAAGSANLEQQLYTGAAALQAAAADGGSTSWLSAAVAARAAAGHVQEGSAGMEGSWRAAVATGCKRIGGGVMSPAAAAALAPAGVDGSSSGSRKKSQTSAAAAKTRDVSSTLQRCLLEYDERYRYTTEQLVGLRGAASGAGSAAAAGLVDIPAELKANSADSWRRTSE